MSQAIDFLTIDRTELGLQIQHRQQSTKTDKLSNHHPKLDDLLIVEMFMKPHKKGIVDTLVIQRQLVRILEGNAFTVCKRIRLFIQLRDFIFT